MKTIISFVFVIIILVATGFQKVTRSCEGLYEKPYTHCTQMGSVQTFYEGNNQWLHKVSWSCGIYGNFENICYSKSSTPPPPPQE